MLIFEYSGYGSLNQLINEDYYYIGLHVCDSGNSVTHYTRCNYHDSISYILAKTAIKKMQRWRGIFLVKLIAASFVLEDSKRSIFNKILYCYYIQPFYTL